MRHDEVDQLIDVPAPWLRIGGKWGALGVQPSRWAFIDPRSFAFQKRTAIPHGRLPGPPLCDIVLAEPCYVGVSACATIRVGICRQHVFDAATRFGRCATVCFVRAVAELTRQTAADFFLLHCSRTMQGK